MCRDSLVSRVRWSLTALTVGFLIVSPLHSQVGMHKPATELGGRVTFSPAAFEVVPRWWSLRGGRREADATGPLQSPPFTEEEILKVAPPGRIKTRRVPVGNAFVPHYFVVRPAKIGGAMQRPYAEIPLADYLAELNRMEAWLNRQGVTLRDGPLSRRPFRGPVEQDLGLKFRLKRKPEDGSDPSRASGRRFKDLDLIPVPTPVRDRFGPVAGGLVEARERQGLPANPMWRIDQVPRVGAAANLGDVRPFLSKAFEQAGSGFSAPLLKLQSACAPKPCTLVYNKDYALNLIGQRVLDDYREVVDHTCEGVMTGFGCVGTMVTTYNSWRAIAVANFGRDFVDFFLANFQNPCLIKDRNLDFFRWTYKKLEASESGSVTEVVGKEAKSFFDGKLLYVLPYSKQCLIDYSGNAWFGASLCMRYATSNAYEKSKGFAFYNSAGMKASFTVFGIDNDLVDGDAIIEWKQGQPPPGAPPVQVSNAATDSTLAETNDTQAFKGPSAVFALGPIPLTITSFLTTTLSVAQPTPNFTAPPLTPGVAGQGTIGMSVGATAGAGVRFDAAVTALIISAGVSGTLDLLTAKVDGGITSTIDPKANELTIDRGLGFHSTNMAGHLDAYVEIDLLAYTKRWSVEIAGFSGGTTDIPFAVKQTKRFAVDPATIQQTPVCP